MLHVPTGAQSYGGIAVNYGTARPANSLGVLVTPGTSGYGSWFQLFAAQSFDAYGLLMCLSNNGASATNRHSKVKLGIDEAGGTSYVDRIDGLLCGATANLGPGTGAWYFFPVFIPAGSTIAVAAHSTVTTAFRVMGQLFGAPPNPAMIRKASFVEAIGLSGLTGVAVTGGTTSEGAWTLVGSSTKRCWWWQFGFQVDLADTAWNAATIFFDIAVGDATNKDIILLDQGILTGSNELYSNPPVTLGCEWDVPAGSDIYVRAQSSGSLDTFNIVAYGAG